MGSIEAIDQGNVLVAIGYLHDHSVVRTVNAQLRVKAPQGCTAYLSMLTVASSRREFEGLKTFLSWGENGADSFLFRSAVEFMLPEASDHPSSWDRELELLQQIEAENVGAFPEIARRIKALESPDPDGKHLFLPGQTGELAIANDFVYMDTKQDKEKISQADIYLAISNLWACRRNDNVGMRPDNKATDAIEWRKSVYAQVLMCPQNLADYNDAVLRAAFLRACSPSELCYAVDETTSALVLDVMLAEIDQWAKGQGDSLPEFILALATRRLSLAREHERHFVVALGGAALPGWLEKIAHNIGTNQA